MQLVADLANTGSRRVAEAAGYRAEGVLRQGSLHRGRPVDDVIYSLLATDPRPEPPYTATRVGWTAPARLRSC
jgi:RimJ/RimL family protein N-acetyltransferase